MRIRHHEQNIRLPSKFGVPFTFSQQGSAQELIVCCVNIKWNFCVQVKNKPCVVCTVIMRLISWIRSRGSETVNT
jgi:hypothetical protein